MWSKHRVLSCGINRLVIHLLTTKRFFTVSWAIYRKLWPGIDDLARKLFTLSDHLVVIAFPLSKYTSTKPPCSLSAYHLNSVPLYSFSKITPNTYDCVVFRTLDSKFTVLFALKGGKSGGTLIDNRAMRGNGFNTGLTSHNLHNHQNAKKI